jgi:ABC-2 type transport system ATP-binding protein
VSAPAGAIGLLGPNGAGKSTLLKVLLGLVPFDGQARVLGLDPRAEAPKLRARIGYMPERDAHLPGFSAVELCAYAGELSGLPAPEALERAHATLDLVGLRDKRYQVVDGYSTGMKQRVKLAQALVHDPRLLLLDEPTNGLDPEGREEVLGLIRSLPERTGASVLLSSHLLKDVETVCGQALLLHHGRLLYAGPLERLRGEGTEGQYEVRVKEGGARFLAALTERGLAVVADGELVVVRVPVDEAAPTRAIFAAARAANVQVRHLAPRRLTLESAFVRAVSEA